MPVKRENNHVEASEYHAGGLGSDGPGQGWADHEGIA